MNKEFNIHHPQIIGIDPDLAKNGVALVEQGQLKTMSAKPFVELMAYIDANPDALFAVEDVEYNKPVFNRYLNKPQNLKVAQNVGMVKGVARHIFEYLEYRDCLYVRVPPLKGRLKTAKDDAKYFNRLTGWQGRSSADKRDAALIALYGVRPNQLVLRPSQVPY